MTSAESYPFSDVALARRLEKAEGRSNLEFVEARAQVSPESGACWVEVAGAYAMYDGVGSPLTQTFGLGMFEPVTEAALAELEEFYESRGAEVFHEFSPLADPSALAQLNERGYQPVEFTSVMFKPIAQGLRPSAPLNERLRVRTIREGEYELWAQTAARGWSSGFPELTDFMLELSGVSARRAGGLSFIAELDGEAIATGALSIHEGVALLAGASTVPEARKQGAQRALLETRLATAAERGCDLAMMCALPGSASQRNAERQGFRIAYTRIKWKCGMRNAE
ncbi:MAG TPA: GNAT family N-acetyltransferase [Pyrinomonadaceae bacterium]|nr:GNAT family N-acetyltransferase [Pyrinomonadaceae bacterium]